VATHAWLRAWAVAYASLPRPRRAVPGVLWGCGSGLRRADRPL